MSSSYDSSDVFDSDDSYDSEDSFASHDGYQYSGGRKRYHTGKQVKHGKHARHSPHHTSPSPSTGSCAGVYILKDNHNRYYVGKSQNMAGRIEDHMHGNGTSFLSGNITSVQSLTSGSANDLESWERSETLARMHRHGIKNVRGWMFTTQELSDRQLDDAFNQICEKFDFCRRCGRNSHFIQTCYAKSKAYWAL